MRLDIGKMPVGLCQDKRAIVNTNFVCLTWENEAQNPQSSRNFPENLVSQIVLGTD